MTRRRSLRRVRRGSKGYGLAIVLTIIVVVIVAPFRLIWRA
jgi:Tfp pilus assembly protein PilX